MMWRWCGLAIAIAGCGGAEDVFSWSTEQQTATNLGFDDFAVDDDRVVLAFYPQNAGEGHVSVLEGGEEKVIVEGTDPIPTLWAADGTLYFREGSEIAIQAVSLDGGEPRVLAEVPGEQCFMVGIAGERLLVNCTTATFAVPLAGGAPEMFHPSSVLHPSVRDGMVYFVDPRGENGNGASVKRIPIAGGTAETLFERPGGGPITGFAALEDALIFFYDDGVLMRLEYDGGDATMVGDIAGPEWNTTDGKRLYVISTPGLLSNLLSASIFAIDADGDMSEVVGDRGYCRFLQLAGGFVYWIEDEGVEVVHLRRAGI